MSTRPEFDLSPFPDDTSSYLQDGHTVTVVTQTIPNIPPETLWQSVIAPNFYRCSDFGYERLIYSVTLRVDPSNANRIDLLSAAHFLGFTTVFIVRQNAFHNSSPDEYVMQAYALPQTQFYTTLLKRLGFAADDDGRVWIEWRIRSNGNGGSRVFLAFIESRLPEWAQRWIYGLVMSRLFNSYIEGFQKLKTTRDNIVRANAWKIPPSP